MAKAIGSMSVDELVRSFGLGQLDASLAASAGGRLSLEEAKGVRKCLGDKFDDVVGKQHYHVVRSDEACLGKKQQVVPPELKYAKGGKLPKGWCLPKKEATIELHNGKTRSWKSMTKMVDKQLAGSDEEKSKAQKFLKENGIARTPDGKYAVKEARVEVELGKLGPGVNKNGCNASVFKFLNRSGTWPYLLGGMGATGGLLGGVTGLSVGSAMKAGAGGSGGGIGGIGLPTAAGLGGIGGWGGVGSAMQFAGFDGMAFQFKKQMKAIAADFQDQSMINMLNNPGIPIEDLIFLFMAYMANKYEDRLREKMEEAALAEKLQRRRDMLMDRVNMAAGVLSCVPVLGPFLGGGYRLVVQKQIELETAFNGGGKSTTILMAEVQMLVQKWKQLNEMLSNLSKTLHDMAMTPVRNLR